MAPVFLSRAQVEGAHAASLAEHGGLSGLRSEHALDSALAAPLNDFYYDHADLHAIAAAYAFHLAQAQAFLDGNKRTAIIAALTFLKGNGLQTREVDTYDLYEDLSAVASRQMNKADLAVRFRGMFALSEDRRESRG